MAENHNAGLHGVDDTLLRVPHGTSSVHLFGATSIGPIELDADEFTHGGDRSLVVTAKVGRTKISRSVFSYNWDESVFLHMQDGKHSTEVTLQSTEDAARGFVTVRNDHGRPQVFDVDIPTFVEKRDHALATAGSPTVIDQVGKRSPPALVPVDLYKLFRKDPGYLAFTRGALPDIAMLVEKEIAVARKARGVNWKCAWICAIPACGITCLFWSPLKKDKPVVRG